MNRRPLPDHLEARPVKAFYHLKEMNMTPSNIIRTVAVALALGTTGLVAQANGDIYSRLMEMREMDRNHDGMISKDEFLAMIAKAWDMKAAEMKVKSGKMSPEQIKELEKVLGRTLSGS